MSNAPERITGALQENLLTLLCFDDKYAKIIRGAVTPQLFESAAFREVAGKAMDFLDQFGEPIKDHLPDEFDAVLRGDDRRKSQLYERLLKNLKEASEGVNAEYVVAQLQTFIRQQSLKSGIIDAFNAMQEGQIDQAELALNKALKRKAAAFDAGLNFSNIDTAIGLFDHLEEPGFTLGIEPFDHAGIYPRRKELLMFMAPRGRGKSWFCTHAAKRALLQRWVPIIITLELSQNRYAVRVMQSLFSVSRRNAEVQVARLISERGRLQDIIFEKIERGSLEDPQTQLALAARVRREFRRRPPLIIKEFPTSAVGVDALEAYLDALEEIEGVTGDVLIVDYPDLLQHDPKNKRIEIGHIVERLRGIGVARNMAVIVPTQGNRESESAIYVETDHAAEDISKIATADTVITMSQTKEERLLGLARLLAGKARNEKDRVTALITQAYGIGQFCLDSVAMVEDDYWGILNPRDRRDDDQEEERPRGRGRRSR